MRFHSARGFTLVELAIVLIVIGLIIGGALRGREMIHSAQITGTIAQIKAFDGAAAMFRDTYGALPGDIKNASLRLPNCTGMCNIDGNENGKIEWTYDLTPSGDDIIEPFNFFPHLQKAGMISSPFGGQALSNLAYPPTKTGSTNHKEFSPAMPLKSIWALYVIFAHSDRGHGAKYEGMNDVHYYSLSDISALEAGSIDKKLDNGNGFTGEVVLFDAGAGPTPVSPCVNTDGIYLEKASANIRCYLWIQTEF